MIIEDYVSFETAKLLKEKGFNVKCDKCYAYFADNDIRLLNLKYPKSAQLLIENRYPCITLQMTMKWLRKVYHWHIFAIPKWEDVECMPGEWEEKMVGYQYSIINIGEFNVKYEQPTITALSSESACEAAIKYCLEHLI